MFSNSKIVALRLRCPNVEHLVENFGKSFVLLINAFQFQNSSTKQPIKMCAKKEISKSKRNWVKRSLSAVIYFVLYMLQSSNNKVQFVSSVSYCLNIFVIFCRHFSIANKNIHIKTRVRKSFLGECFV